MVFGQLSNRESFRDLISTLDAHKEKFHHLGFGTSETRSNLSKANELREVKLFEDTANLLIKQAQSKRASIKDPLLDGVDGQVFAFDSSTIPLCLNTFWRSRLHHDKGGVKLHTLYDVQTDIPAMNIITNANVHDSKTMSQTPYNKGDWYVFDRAYMVTEQLHRIDSAGAYFVVREKHKMRYEVIVDKNYNNPETGIGRSGHPFYRKQNTGQIPRGYAACRILRY